RIRPRPIDINPQNFNHETKYQLKDKIILVVPFNEEGFNSLYNNMLDEKQNLFPEYLIKSRTKRFDDRKDGVIFLFHKNSYIKITETEYEKIKILVNDSLMKRHGKLDSDGFTVLPPSIAKINRDLVYSRVWLSKKREVY